MHRSFRLTLSLLTLPVIWLAGCSQLPTVGPSQEEVREAASRPGAQVIQVVDVDDPIARRLLALRKQRQFSETLGPALGAEPVIGAGDSLEVNIWEAPPAALFGAGVLDLRGVAASVHATTLPEQVVDREGSISVPFAGRIRAAGLTPQALEAEIVRRLKGKANQPEALVRVLRNASSNVTVVGEVTNSMRMPLTAGGERLLDALAAAGGVRQPVSKITLQVTRGEEFHAMPLDQVIRDPKQNVPLRSGDVVTALFQPLSFTALGATGKNEEINFEVQGISLAQALGRAGGLVDTRSDPRSVFIFRFEQASALDWPRQPVATTADGLVPVVYRVDLLDPSSFFVMQSFAINNKDVLYISNAPAAELQKFLNIMISGVYPVINVLNWTQ
jgi:polysaccharide export outer membrane protein